MDLLPNAAVDSLIDLDGVKDICVIGAGAGGLAALKIISETPQYKSGRWRPTAFEMREKVGGVWFPASPTGDFPLTPLYDSLTTNLPHPVMAFHSFPFPPSTPLYPPASTVETYLQAYAAHYKLGQHIRFNTAVLSADWDGQHSKWTVRITGDEVLTFDLLIVANGHYHVPRFPDTPGLAAWLAQGKASHSAWYRRPHDIGNTVLVVGGGYSGIDISAEMRTAAQTVLHSVTGGEPEDLDDGAFKRRGRIAEFGDPSQGRVVFEDGTVDEEVDHCILATGYEFSFPFLSPPLLEGAVPPAIPPLPPTLYNSSYNLFPLARHVFPLVSTIPPSRLVFLGLPIRVVPFPLMEVQARAVIKAFAQPESLDPLQEAVAIVARYETLRARVGDSEAAIAEAWHRFQDQEQFEYRDELHAWIGGEYAGPEWKVPTWTRELYGRKDVLRSEWKELERLGEAEEWVRGVGEHGESEWVDLLYRLLRRVDKKGQAEFGKL
ncbi:hypothetical protein BKA93DRAFT_819467 [Sparassis latifolia]